MYQAIEFLTRRSIGENPPSTSKLQVTEKTKAVRLSSLYRNVFELLLQIFPDFDQFNDMKISSQDLFVYLSLRL